MNELLKQFINDPTRIKAVECGSLNSEDSNYYLLHQITSPPNEYFLAIEYLPAVDSKNLTEEIQSICTQNLGVTLIGVYKPLPAGEYISISNKIKLTDFVLTSFSKDLTFLADYLLLKVNR